MGDSGGVEVQSTEGIYIVAEEDRGAGGRPRRQRLQSGFGAAGYGGETWRATIRANFASEDRGNGTPLQVNDTEWHQFAGDVNGVLAGGFWTARMTGGSQDYFQTFSAIAANRQTERLTNDQTVPGDFFTGGGQWMRAWKAADMMVGVEGRQTNADINDTRYPVTGAPVLRRCRISRSRTRRYTVASGSRCRPDLSLILGARGDHWKSTRSENFFSPRASVTWRASDLASLQFSVARSYRTPTLNELYRGFRAGNIVTNANPLLAPERLTSVEGGVLIGHGRASVRVTGFKNVLDERDLEHHDVDDPGADHE